MYFDTARDGPLNMSLDEVMQEQALRDGMAHLRFYQWSQPTVSLGYFQSYADRQQHLKSRNCSVVRRPTGGGAIVHDRELTYCFALAVSNRFSVDHRQLYRAFHQSLLRALSDWDVAGQIQAEQSSTTTAPPPFLCFQRHARDDLLLHGQKIAGSAQRRRAGVLLQHGSVTLAKSAFAPEIPGIGELAGIGITPAELAHSWLSQLVDQLQFQVERRDIGSHEEKRATCIVSKRYGSADWTRKR